MTNEKFLAAYIPKKKAARQKRKTETFTEFDIAARPHRSSAKVNGVSVGEAAEA